jgi:hypothetical protein
MRVRTAHPAAPKARANNAVADKPSASLWPRIQTGFVRSNARTALAKMEAVSVRAALKAFIGLQSAGGRVVCPAPPSQAGLASIFVARRCRLALEPQDLRRHQGGHRHPGISHEVLRHRRRLPRILQADRQAPAATPPALLISFNARPKPRRQSAHTVRIIRPTARRLRQSPLQPLA